MLELSDYQIPARDHLLANTFAGLFDAPGVGKTAPAIVAGYHKSQETGLPVLITCPAYLCENWAYEISRFAPDGTTVSIANGAGRAARDAALSSDDNFVITGYSNWSAKTKGSYTYPVLTRRSWGAVIFDEAHRLRGRNSQCTRHVYQLRMGRRKTDTPIWCLTGTPIVNNPGDLFPLFHLWDKRTYSGYWNFVGEWCRTTKTPWATEVGQLRPGLEEEFQALVGQFALRRVLVDVPSLATLEQRDRDYYVVMPKSIQKMIATAREEYILEHEDLEVSEFVSGGGALYARLRQLATNPPTAEKPKVDFVRDFLEDRPKPVVVYCWYKDSARAVADGLVKTKRPVTLITGDTPSTRRGELVKQWSNTANGVLVATISSLKEGISLVAATDVVFLEHSELPADQEQCIARLKRRGQSALVNVHHVWARGTPDMAIEKAVRKRTSGLKRALVSWLKEG